jgi:hypothetical protein
VSIAPAGLQYTRSSTAGRFFVPPTPGDAAIQSVAGTTMAGVPSFCRDFSDTSYRLPELGEPCAYPWGITLLLFFRVFL